jgi:hypothetical protein
MKRRSYRKYKEPAHMSLVDRPISRPSLDISPIWTPVITADVKTTSSSVDGIGKLFCLMLAPLGVTLFFSDDFYRDSSLVQGLIPVEFLII